MEKRNKFFVINSFSSLFQQIVTIICGLILPRIILSFYGSAVNGLTSSISQFLSVITLLQGGVGALGRIAYYKTLASEDNMQISSAFNTISDFFKKFGLLFSVYLLIVAGVYPLVINTGFDYGYVFTLAIVLGLTSVFEYFFGQASQILLSADQKGYIYSIVQTICVILSTIICIILVDMEMSIQVVKLASALIYIIRPVTLYIIVRKKYCINRKAAINKEYLSQRAAAFVRHIAYYIHTSTDVMVLTIFSNVLWVSVYAVHKYVINSLSQLVSNMLSNSEAVFGDMIARSETDNLKKTYNMYDLFSKVLSCSCFFTCIILINQFVSLYTKNVSDINYYQPLFATILALSEMVYCMSITCQNVYVAAGHLKQTEWLAVTEALVNIVVSVALVIKLGIVGVAVGTLLAMSFKSIASIIYVRKHIFKLSLRYMVMSYVVNFACGALMCFLFYNVFYIKVSSFMSFFIYAFAVFVVNIVVFCLVNLIFFRNDMKKVLKMFFGRFIKKLKK